MPTPMQELREREDVAAAIRWITARDAATLETQRTITGIESPPFGEARRGAWMADQLRAIGLQDVATDDLGNVTARFGSGGAPVIVCSHLDTVFEAGTPLDLRQDGDRVIGPGIGDNARGLAALLTLAEALVRHRVKLPRPVIFMASVGEEGEGDLRGVKHFFNHAGSREPDHCAAFIALDGPGLDRIVHRALGSKRLRATFTGPGGHSWAAFGVANPAHAVGLAVAKISEIQLPASPRAALSVVRIGGGQSLNTIPTEAWLELDLRAETETVIGSLHDAVMGAIERARDVVNRSRAAGTPPLATSITPLGERPSGGTDEQHPLVQAAVEATRAVGGIPSLATASTDANVAISRGIPGIALGAGGRGGDAHLLSEWYENTNAPAGIIRCLLTLAAEW